MRKPYKKDALQGVGYRKLGQEKRYSLVSCEIEQVVAHLQQFVSNIQN